MQPVYFGMGSPLVFHLSLRKAVIVMLLIWPIGKEQHQNFSVLNSTCFHIGFLQQKVPTMMSILAKGNILSSPQHNPNASHWFKEAKKKSIWL